MYCISPYFYNFVFKEFNKRKKNHLVYHYNIKVNNFLN